MRESEKNFHNKIIAGRQRIARGEINVFASNLCQRYRDKAILQRIKAAAEDLDLMLLKVSSEEGTIRVAVQAGLSYGAPS